MLFIYFQGKIKFSHCIWSFWLNFYFYLVLPFYLLKWDCYFSAYENLPNSSCNFWKHKSVFLQILHHSSMLSNITPLYFFSSDITYVGQKQPIKVQHFEIFEWSGQNSWSSSCQFLNSYIFYFGLKDPIKFPVWTLLSVLVKIYQIPPVIFPFTSQFFFKFCISLQCHER